MKIVPLLPATACLLLASCAFAPYYYNFSPVDAHRRTAASGDTGSVAFAKEPDSAAARCTLSDSLVNIRFCITTYQIEFTITNKTGRTLKVDWEKSVYTNPRGVRKRVIHKGIVYAQKEVFQHPSLIYKGETLSDVLLPSENVMVYLYGSGGWNVAPIFLNADLGRTAQVLFALEIDGVMHEYTVRFVINSV
jgi:hypothetical protein